MMQFLSLYLHIPFCRHRCSYCAFNIYTDQHHLSAAYVQALAHEMDLLGQQQDVHTVYIGGGTPSLLRIAEVEQIMQAIQQHFSLQAPAEITFEVNPNTVAGDYLVALHELGINRLSLGMQSAQDATLQLFERDHTLDDTLRLVERAKAAGFSNISLDLIYGVPQQTLAAWEETLDLALSCLPAHFSLYALQLEAGTQLTKQVKQGILPPPDEDLAAEMYDLACEKLAGYSHYEISSWGLPSRHNQQYWLNLPYLGLGAGAHGYADNIRTVNTMRPERYIERVWQDTRPLPYPRTPATQSFEVIAPHQAMFESIMLGLRLLERGLDIKTFEARFQVDFRARYGKIVARLLARGWLRESDSHLYLTPQAYLIANTVLSEFWMDS